MAEEAMQKSLIDTDILSMFLKGNKKVKENFKKYIYAHKNINFSIITYYEILSGLRHRDATKQLEIFLKLASISAILPLTIEFSEKSAIIYAGLRKKGTPVDDIDILIAGIALENSMRVVTNNVSHFGRIEKLKVSNWS